MKKIFSMFLVVMLSMIGMNNVDAQRGVSYAIGDLITVKINSTETRQFYVIENSNASSNNVVAISKDFLGSKVPYHRQETEGCYISTSYADSYIKGIVDSRTASWTNITSVSLLSIEQIQTLIGTTIINPSAIVNYQFNNSLPISSTAKYWTMSRATFQPNDSECDVWYIDGRNVSQSTGCTANEVRPVINVDKEHIIDQTNPGGTNPGGTNPGTQNPETDNVENPQTGLLSPYIFGGIALIGIVGVVFYFRKKNYFIKF